MFQKQALEARLSLGVGDERGADSGTCSGRMARLQPGTGC